MGRNYEVELVVAIGKAGRDIAVADALSHVWSAAVAVDLTRRDLQDEAKATRLPVALYRPRRRRPDS